MASRTNRFKADASAGRHRPDCGYLVVAGLGMGLVMAALVIAVAAGLKVGNHWALTAPARTADKVRSGQIAAIGAWDPALLFLGISLLMTAVVVVLRRIIATIRARGETLVSYLPGLIRGGVS